MSVRGIPPVPLLAVALSLCLCAPAFAAPQTWIVTEGTATLSLDDSHLANLGLAIAEARETAVVPGARDLAMEPVLRSFGLADGSQLTFRTDNGAFQGFDGSRSASFDGGLALRTFHPRTGQALSPAFLFDFTLEMRLDEEVAAISIRTSDPSVPVPLEVRSVGSRFWWERGELALVAGDVVITREWARQLGQPELEGQWVGAFDVRFRATPQGGEALVPDPPQPVIGGGTLDVMLGELYGLTSQGHTGTYPTGFAGLSAATTSCNNGQVDVPWNAPMAETHPFIALALFRLDANNVLEMIGKNWMKHGFFALSNDQCDLGCPSSSNGTYLAIGCSDTYSSFHNGNRFYLGPREEVNPFTGAWEACGSYFDEPTTPDGDCQRDYNGTEPDGVAHRLEVYDGDLDNAGATYFYEGMYVVADDDRRDNNIGWRECSMSWTGSNWSVSTVGGGLAPNIGTVVKLWGETIGDQWETAHLVDGLGDPVDGTFQLAVDVTDLGGGIWHYEYTFYNRDSERGAFTFAVPIGDATLTNIGFHDIDQDSGNEWTVDQSHGLITWSTDDYATDPDANAITYQEMFNFRFDADAPPLASSATAGMFKPGPGGSSLLIDTQAPQAAATSVLAGVESVDGLTLSRNEPNPFSNQTELRFSLERSGHVRLSVLDVTGRTVQVLVNGESEAGIGTASWNGRDASGSLVASGIYFFRLDAAGETRTIKGTFLR